MVVHLPGKLLSAPAITRSGGRPSELPPVKREALLACFPRIRHSAKIVFLVLGGNFDAVTIEVEGHSSGGDTDPVDEDADDDGPGFGVGGAIASLGGLGYLLKRRVTETDAESE